MKCPECDGGSYVILIKRKNGHTVNRCKSCGVPFVDESAKKKDVKKIKRFKTKNHEMHYRLWDFLAKNTDKDKTDWPEWESNGGDARENDQLCFACLDDKSGDCSGCPVSWEGGKTCIGKGEYNTWEYASASDDRSKLAKKIRDKEWVVK